MLGSHVRTMIRTKFEAGSKKFPIYFVIEEVAMRENRISNVLKNTPRTVSGVFTVIATIPLNGLGNAQTLTLGQTVPDGSILSVTYTAGGL